MSCRITDIIYKDVISIKNGLHLGVVSDVEVDRESAKIVSVVIYGKKRLFGLLGREDDLIIPWEAIELIGEDTMLVDYIAQSEQPKKKHGFWGSLFD